jgi:hypothetical protein
MMSRRMAESAATDPRTRLFGTLRQAKGSQVMEFSLRSQNAARDSSRVAGGRNLTLLLFLPCALVERFSTTF